MTTTNITVNVGHNGRGSSFSAGVQLPTNGGTGPFPAVVVLGGSGADTAAIRAAGAAVINYDPYSVGREGTFTGSTNRLPPPRIWASSRATRRAPARRRAHRRLRPVGGAASVSVNAWTGGFVATIKVTAGAGAINGWTVALTLPPGATITQPGRRPGCVSMCGCNLGAASPVLLRNHADGGENVWMPMIPRTGCARRTGSTTSGWWRRCSA